MAGRRVKQQWLCYILPAYILNYCAVKSWKEDLKGLLYQSSCSLDGCQDLAFGFFITDNLFDLNKLVFEKFFEVVVNFLLCFWSALPPTTNCNIGQIILFHPVIFLLQKSAELGNICQIDSSNNQRLNIIRCFHFFLRDDDKNLISIFKLELLEFLPILHKLSWVKISVPPEINRMH